MRMSCGRSDAELKNQAGQIQDTTTLVEVPSLSAAYYNRLECRSISALFLIAAHPLLRFPTATAMLSSFHSARTLTNNGPSLGHVLLARGPKSCNKQVWSATPFRRGMAS
jgi:hypothetical protein